MGALINDSGFSPASYQSFVARKSYAQYQIDYKPLGQNGFVLSGEGNGKIFYEKVMFSCEGRLINSFALIYASNERAEFDRIVERMEGRTELRTGRSSSNTCATREPNGRCILTGLRAFENGRPICAGSRA